MTLLQKAFKFRTCHLDIREDDDSRRFFRPCLLYADQAVHRAVRGEDPERRVRARTSTG